MQNKAKTVQEYLNELPADRRSAIEAVRKTILKHLPKGYEETMQYGMIGYVVPLKLYPQGYLGDKNTPLPFAGLASQKNHMAVYHFQDLQRRLEDEETIKVSDFPNVMLPFEFAFLEMRVRNNPSFEATFEECGVFAQMVKPEKLDFSELGPSLKRAKQIFLHKDAAYLLICQFFAYGRGLAREKALF